MKTKKGYFTVTDKRTKSAAPRGRTTAQAAEFNIGASVTRDNYIQLTDKKLPLRNR